MTLPTFIIIGAAKAGTTALYWYFAEHPDVFMSPVKETFYFAYGRDASGHLLYGDPDVHRFPVTTLAEYEALFSDASGARDRRSIADLPRVSAVRRPYTKPIPDVRLVCILRHPVDRAFSDYLMYIRRRNRPFDPRAT